MSLLVLTSCANEFYAQESQSESQNSDTIDAFTIVNKSIEFHGGMDAYDTLQTFFYKKTSWRHDSIGAIIDTTVQDIKYDFGDKLKDENKLNGEIHWVRDTLDYTYICIDTCGRYKNGFVDKKYPSKAAEITFTSSHYVLFMPFKLLDSGVELSYLGKDKLEDDTEVFVVEARYDKEKPNHNKSHIWQYYFNTETYRLEGGMVNMNNHFSYIRNESFSSSQNLLLHEKRKSYKVDSLRNIQVLRVSYLYEYPINE